MRILPIAERLKASGHTVLVAVRDIRSAAHVFGPRGITFVQAPHLPQGIPLAHRATGYADILLSQGWSDRSTLWGLVQGWLNLYGLFRPDRLILDYSPTASLAARIAEIPVVLIGNGFELPPLTDPLPPFPGFSWADPEKAEKSERLAISNANAALEAIQQRPLAALRDLFGPATRLFATVPELDHYGARSDGHYIGPLLGDLPQSQRLDWPEGEGPRIFACIRPDTSHVQCILSALAVTTARVVCVASGFQDRALEPFCKRHIHFTQRPVDLSRLLAADLCISYGAEGTIMKFVLAGVPQLVSPWHVEAFMAGRKIAAAHLGLTIESPPTVDTMLEYISRLLGDVSFRAGATEFRMRATTQSENHAVTATLEALCLPSQTDRVDVGDSHFTVRHSRKLNAATSPGLTRVI
jgi:UDP:flavonoid glycosyltransferase YjiC (YdhE family)